MLEAPSSPAHQFSHTDAFIFMYMGDCCCSAPQRQIEPIQVAENAKKTNLQKQSRPRRWAER